jgi:hypothetical protein
MFSKLKEMCGEKCCENKEKCCTAGKGNSCGNTVYCMGVIGAAVYFIGQATSFGAGVVGLLKAFVWPAFLVYEAFKLLLK